MPAVAAHYQFGQVALNQMPSSAVAVIEQNKAMFDLGTQGPDLLFYFRPYQKNAISEIGSAHHQKTGADFLLSMWQDRADWSPAQTAYLLGFCCHYALDRRCHPFVNDKAPTGKQHALLESAFDRVVIDQYQLTEKRQQMLPVLSVSIDALHRIYRDVTKAQLREAVCTIHHANTLLGHPQLVGRLEGLVGKKGSFSSMCLPQRRPGLHARMMMPIFYGAVPEAVTLMTLLLDPNTTAQQLKQAMPENFEGVCN